MAVYLDHAATTPLRPEALEAMLPFLGGTFGNPSSTHAFGRVAREALDDAHERLARSIGADAREIVFTSGGTEANNLALKGAAWAGRARGHRIVTTPVEHHAIGHTLEHLQKFGFEVVEVPVDRYGRVDPEEVERAITDRTILVTVMLANNEVGTIQPVAEVAEVVRARRGLLFHVDAVQAAPWLDLDVNALGADLVALAAHKAEGPKGTGALWIRRGTHILAQQHGGSQERYRRAGTENVAGAVGMATAFELRAAERATLVPKVRARRDRLLTALTAVDGRGGHGPPGRAAPAHRLGHRPRHRRRLDHGGPRPRGHRGVDGLGLHQRLHRGQPRPDGDGLPARGGARRTPAEPRPNHDRRGDRRGGAHRAGGHRAAPCRGPARALTDAVAVAEGTPAAATLEVG